MADRAFLRSWFVEQNRLAFDLAHQLVAISAFHIRVHALQRKGGAPVVIEERRFPFGAVVALGTGRYIAFRKLLAVRVFVALLALFGRGLEVRVHHRGFEIWRFVAIDAGGRAVRTQQRESRRRVIELGQFLPRFGRMARLASTRTTRCLCLLHALIELPLVRIGMATGAAQSRPVINRGRGLEIGGLFVAIGTRYRNVFSSQKEARLFMACQRERRGPIGIDRVAAFTRIEIRRWSELPGVLVFMTVGAVLELHLEHRVDASRDVAFLASDFRVSPLQRI